MVDVNVHRYFDSRFLQFGLTALVLKFIVYYIQSQLNPDNMSYMAPDTVVIMNGNSTATIHLFGATLTSWIVDNYEVLFVSENAVFDQKKAIRGGVPVVFPHFGPWELGPQHGFARITPWTIKDGYTYGSNSVTLLLEDSDETRAYWNHKFRIEYTIELENPWQVKMEARIVNEGEESFPFTFLFHTYFAVPSVLFCKIKGLSGCMYIDKLRNGVTFKEERDEVTVTDFTDSIYLNTPLVQKVKHISGQRSAVIEKYNLPDLVVWNPGLKNAQEMSDFKDEEWQHMLCVEAGMVSTPVVLEPKKAFFAMQVLNVSQ